MPDETDETLLELAGRSEKAFMLLFERHREVIYRLAYRLTNSSEVAEDIAQDCFLSLLSGPNRFDAGKGSLSTYLYAIVRNLARKHYWQRDGELELDDCEADAEPDEAPEPARLFLQHEMSQLVQQAVLALPGPQREALILFHYEELSLEEVANVLSVEVGTIKSRLHRARVRLKRALAPYFQGSTHDETIR
jgi:RNA polymerase sigma-70 factor (ECF subfamily)